jgi:hypothetical protein
MLADATTFNRILRTFQSDHQFDIHGATSPTPVGSSLATPMLLVTGTLSHVFIDRGKDGSVGHFQFLPQLPQESLG